MYILILALTLIVLVLLKILNVCSLLPKMDLDRTWIIQTDADVLVISETWLKKSTLDKDIVING